MQMCTETNSHEQIKKYKVQIEERKSMTMLREQLSRELYETDIDPSLKCGSSSSLKGIFYCHMFGSLLSVLHKQQLPCFHIPFILPFPQLSRDPNYMNDTSQRADTSFAPSH